MSFFDKIIDRHKDKIQDTKELFSSPSAASEAKEGDAAKQAGEAAEITTAIGRSRTRATSLGAGTAAERRAGASEFATTAFEKKGGTGIVATSVDSSSKVSGREASRMDFAAVTAPHLLLEKRGSTAKGEGVISKKRK